MFHLHTITDILRMYLSLMIYFLKTIFITINAILCTYDNVEKNTFRFYVAIKDLCPSHAR